MKKKDKDYHLEDVIKDETPDLDPEGLPVITVEEAPAPPPAKKKSGNVSYGVVVKYQTWLRQPNGIVELIPAGKVYYEPWAELLEMARADIQQKILGIFEIEETPKAK